MNRKPPVPSEAEIIDAYRSLQSGEAITVEILIQMAQWVRFDPRLGELWLKALGNQWQSLSPVQVRNQNLLQATPAVLGVLLEQYSQFLCPDKERKTFRHWQAVALDGALLANHENFFIGVQPFAGARVREDSERPSRSFKKWGFLGRDMLINKFSFIQKDLQKTAIAAPERRKILIKLIQAKGRITVGDYIAACDDLISKRVAQKDLHTFPGLRCVGSTRAKFYVKDSGKNSKRGSQ